MPGDALENLQMGKSTIGDPAPELSDQGCRVSAVTRTQSFHRRKKAKRGRNIRLAVILDGLKLPLCYQLGDVGTVAVLLGRMPSSAQSISKLAPLAAPYPPMTSATS